jgi:DNA-binding CsgD family transcriptional regulator
MSPSSKVRRQPASESSINSPFGKPQTPSKGEHMMSLLALSHSHTEHHLYEAMLAETRIAGCRATQFTVRRLMELTGLTSYSTVRRALSGLEMKLSIETRGDNEDRRAGNGATFFIYYPEEIFARRLNCGLLPFPKEAQGFEQDSSNSFTIERIIQNQRLSRREAQVALLCMRGLTNAEIGQLLSVSAQTAKFHLRHIFIKFGVKRRAELISKLLMQYSP